MDQIDALGNVISLVHFVYDTGGGQWRIACMPNMTEFHATLYHPNYQRTDSVQATTCPACKKSAAYKGVLGSNAPTQTPVPRGPIRGT